MFSTNKFPRPARCRRRCGATTTSFLRHCAEFWIIRPMHSTASESVFMFRPHSAVQGFSHRANAGKGMLWNENCVKHLQIEKFPSFQQHALQRNFFTCNFSCIAGIQAFLNRFTSIQDKTISSLPKVSGSFQSFSVLFQHLKTT